MKFPDCAKVLFVVLAALGCRFQALALEPALAAPGAAPEPAAGQVSMVLGGAWLDTPGEERRRISIGTQVGAGDFVRTEPNGHVHIRFIDNALISVRPDSRLEIVRYEYDRANPSLSTVKFSLEEGVARSISGEAARTARERFRLNTPIAAIGVRGTDFVVSATRYSVRALVNEGAIVLAPYSAECTAEAFGPCAASAVELRGDSEQMLGFDIGSPAAEVLPAVHETNPDVLRDDVNSAVANATDAEQEIANSNEAYLEGTASDRVSASLANLSTDGTLVPAAGSGLDPAPDPGAGSGLADLGPAPAPDFTPEVPVGAQENDRRQMVWGRWGAGKGNLERITYAYEAASEGRAVAVGNFDYALFRPDPDGGNVNHGLGTVEFDLAAAQAFYDSGGKTVAMRVSDGALSINFERNVFSTGLTLNHDLTGTVLFSADGRVHAGGFFRMDANGQRVSGAVTLDGAEAGYHFLKQLEAGNISGLTLWDSR